MTEWITTDGLTDFETALAFMEERVAGMTYSEFGRRIRSNASVGTDHGDAAPMFLFGPRVTPGIHGMHPSLSNLDDSDLKYTVDFRSVYATVVERWLGEPSSPIPRRAPGSSGYGPSATARNSSPSPMSSDVPSSISGC